MSENPVEMEDCPPTKKFKQGRLPFKPLDSCQTLQGTSPTGSKKRKLSDNESPSAKQLKTGLGKPVPKCASIDCDPEVSSSSEADTSLQLGHQKGSKKVNTIDRFFKPKPESPDQGEISSTNQCFSIDLTEENSVGTVEEVKGEGTPEKAEKSVTEGNDGEDLEKVSKDVEEESKGQSSDVTVTDDKKDDVDISISEEKEDKENIADEEGTESLDESFVSDTSVCESALKTPAKGAKTASVLKTPVASSSKATDKLSTPKGHVSGSDGTPVSGKKRNSISDSKKKEQLAMRQKLKEEREKEREEKKLQKEKEKEEKEREKQEKKKQKEEERLEKEKQKLEEKEKREKERLEKVKQKEEEKKQKQKELESKMEEKKKKEEERKQKEEERKQKEEEKKMKDEEKKKEEEEKKKKEEKKKSMFKGFFIQKAPTSSPPKVKESGNGLFMPFELKPDMKLAPGGRACLSDERKEAFDEQFDKQDSDELYLKTLNNSAFKPGKSSATWKRNLKDNDDVEVLSHDKETIEKVTHKVKFLLFHENSRPPYYGTWRKPSDSLTPRNPFKQDEALFDYEVDSDDEWEEEEPGESVSSDEEEDEDKGAPDEEEEEADGWMVPHGYLSDDEGIKDDDEVDNASKQDLQRVRQAAWESELKRQAKLCSKTIANNVAFSALKYNTNVDNASKQDLQRVRQAAWESELKRQAKPLAKVRIGCVWQDDTAAIAAQQLQTLLKYKAVCLSEGPIFTSFSDRRTANTDADGKPEEKTARWGSQRKSVPEEAIPELIRLVHGNPYGIKNLIKEFRMYWKLKTNPETEKPETASGSPIGKETPQPGTSMEVDDKVKGEPNTDGKKPVQQDDFAISKRQLDLKIPAIAVREKRSDHKKTCWYVKDEILKQYNMEDIKLPNSWEYVCVSAPKWAEEKQVTPKAEETSATVPAPSGRNTPNIMQFAQPMSPAMILAKEEAALKEAKEQAALREAKEQAALIEQGLTKTAVVAPEAVEATQAATEEKEEAKPNDQRSIKDMFSPASRKIAKSKLSQDKTAKTPSDTDKTAADKLGAIKEKSKTSPVLNLGSLFSVKPIQKSPIVAGKLPRTKGRTTPKQQESSATKTVLMSPELKKVSPKNNTKRAIIVDKMAKPEVINIDPEPEKVSKTNADSTKHKQGSSSKVEPMEVDDAVIVLD